MGTVSETVIIKDPNILGGEPVFSGTRVPFKVLIDYLEGETRWISFRKSMLASAANLPLPPSRKQG